MKLVKAWCMTLGMFTIVPVPPIWDDEAKPWVVPLLPLAGVFPGLLAAGVASLSAQLSLSAFLEVVLVWLAWHLGTGFIHIDGLMDTADALFSRASREKRLAILKDPHVGSFAVIALLVVMLLQLSALEQLRSQGFVLWPWLVIPVLSRSWASLSVLLSPKVLTDGYASQFRSPVKARFLLIPLAALIALPVLAFFQAGWPGLALTAILAAAAGLAWLSLQQSLGGISGDLAGFILVASETAALLAWAILPEVW